jgi:hypothetical protein
MKAYTLLLLIMNIISVCDYHSQVLKLCHIFKELISCPYIIILSCSLVMMHFCVSLLILLIKLEIL